jgi:hypothetical protein
MLRGASWLAVLGVALLGTTCWAAGKAPETVDPAEAMKDPDFLLQGEYLGEKGSAKVGAQAIARGNGKFEVVILDGGLPGAGWKRGDKQVKLEGQREDKKVTLKGADQSGEIADGKLTLKDAQGNVQATLSRVERKSPTLGMKAPAGAVVLFDGQQNAFPGSKLSADGNLMSEAATEPRFNDCTLHVEFRLSWMPEATGQGRSNSGVYVHSCYEIQVLDSFGLEGRNNECGGFYSIKEPDVNMCLPPLVWQTYDIDFTAPKYDSAGNKTANGRITVRHNGVAVHDNLELPKDTPGRQKEGPGPRALYFQGHGNKVEYRNIWAVEKK